MCKLERYDEAMMMMKAALEEIQDNGDLFYLMAQIHKHKQMWEEYKQCMQLAMQNHETLSVQPKVIQTEMDKTLAQVR